MSTKLPCEITKIVLDDASYKGTTTEVFPTYINYFFGNNGTGKSTLAGAIGKGIGVSYAPGKSFSDYIIHVFDQNFIDGNMNRYHNLPGVFTINEINVDIQKQLDKNTEEQTVANKLFAEAAAKKMRKQKRRTISSTKCIRSVGKSQANYELFLKRPRMERKEQSYSPRL